MWLKFQHHLYSVHANTCKEIGLVKKVHAVETSKSRDHPNADPCQWKSTQPKNMNSWKDMMRHLLVLDMAWWTNNWNWSFVYLCWPPTKESAIGSQRTTKEGIKRMENAGVVVKQTEPTDCVNSMVTVIKLEKIRVCIYQRNRNQAIKQNII